MMTIKINNLNDLLNAAYAIKKRFGDSHVWWRGQGQMEWEVSPQLYQKGFSQNESNLSLLFVNKAKVRHHKCPDPKDYPAWLFLMHHYSVPTRLLDWSESILVAAYFAVAEKKFHDLPGALWGLEPTILNQSQIDRKGIMVHQEEEADTLIREAFEGRGTDDSSNRTLAILTDQMDVKQVVQFSTFTIHGSEQSINQMSGAEKFLVKFEIPATAKPQLLQTLELLGIKQSFLFPDLEHLADDLQTIQF